MGSGGARTEQARGSSHGGAGARLRDESACFTRETHRPDACAPHPAWSLGGRGGALKREGPRCLEVKGSEAGARGQRACQGGCGLRPCFHGRQHRTPSSVRRAGRGRWTWFCPRPGASSARSRPGSGRPTWEGGQAAGEGAGLALGPVALFQLALQGVELAVAAVDEVLGSPFRLHLDDENLGQRPGGRTSGARSREGGMVPGS